MPSRFQLRGPTLEAIQARMAVEYGHQAVIVSAERVSVGGVAGLLATRYIEATVEVPSPEPVPAAGPVLPGDSHRRAIAALLEDANAAEEETLILPDLSTSTPVFHELLDTLDHDTGTPGRTANGVPLPATGAGDLIIIAGLGQDGVEEAGFLAAGLGVTVLISGLADGNGPRLDDRTEGLNARRTARIAGTPSVAGFGLGTDQRQVLGQLGYLQALHADQVWLAVDATRKTEDTSAWVKAAASAVKIHGLAVINSARTFTPKTVNLLGIPVGRVDGAPARRPTL